jgi:hypothetical protein
MALRGQQLGRAQFLGGFPSSKVMWPLLKVPNIGDIHQSAKQMKV